ncbi:FadR/GntR family transcriptional regulator [Actinoplanes sp. NPDC049599]|uniref:FadR/GntR family transcriptional regulator n=1 Tax=Actinoplanes sp. NPDC049599 TaxID=3363903 RepID=UPI00378F2D8D
MPEQRTRRAVFAPLTQGGRAAAVTRRLRDAIVLGVLGDGEQLPSEVELAEALGVAPVTARESLQTLRELGLVTTRRGRGGGSFVCAPEHPDVVLVRTRLAELSLVDIRDFGDFYTAIAGAAAALAAERAAGEDLDRLREVGVRRATDPGGSRRAEAQFHLEVAAATQSARLTQEEMRLQAEFGPLLWLSMGSPQGRARSESDHRAIVAAIGRGDRARARALTAGHVGRAIDAVVRARLEVVDD